MAGPHIPGFSWWQRLMVETGLLLRPADRDALTSLLHALAPQETDAGLIRIGSDGDGGYLVPDDLEGIAACFSPGVSTVAHFEEGMIARGIPCQLADWSVDAPPFAHDLIDFEKKFLGAVNHDKFITLQDWMARKAPAEGDLILQMDIEGGEFDVLRHSPAETLRRFRIMVIEFHFLHAGFVNSGLAMLQEVFGKILQDFAPVHLHPNNCCGLISRNGIDIPPVMEFTFLRRDRLRNPRPASRFPHPLDGINAPGKPPLVLPRCWYQGI